MEDNILTRMTEEKQRKIHEVMVAFLGHEPTELDKKEFRIMHGLGESTVFYQDVLIATIRNEVEDDTLQL